jgi:hypothetical protein
MNYFNYSKFDYDETNSALSLFKKYFPFENYEMTSVFLSHAKVLYDAMYSEIGRLTRWPIENNIDFRITESRVNRMWSREAGISVPGWQIVAISKAIYGMIRDENYDKMKQLGQLHRSHMFTSQRLKGYFIYRILVLDDQVSFEEFANILWLCDSVIYSSAKENSHFDIFNYKGKEEEWSNYVRNNSVRITNTEWYQKTHGYMGKALKNPANRNSLLR